MTDKEKQDAYAKASYAALKARWEMSDANGYRIAHPESNDYLVKYLAAKEEYEKFRIIANEAFFAAFGGK